MTPTPMRQAQQAQQTTQEPPQDFQRLLDKPSERTMEFVPFGATDRIKLSVPVVQKLLAVRTKSGQTCSDRDAIRYMMLCQAQRLNPFAGDSFLTGYDGKDGPVFSLIVAHVALLKRAEACEDYEGMDSGVILMRPEGATEDRQGDFVLPTEEAVGGWAIVYRKGRRPTLRRLSIAATRPPYDTPFWNKLKAPGQVVKCAEADALRSTFPTLLGGLMTGHEIGELMGSNIAVELPTNGLVEVRGAPHRTDNQPAVKPTPQDADDGQSETAPEPERESEPPATQDTPQIQLFNVVKSAGFDFTTFQKWGEESGALPDAGGLSRFQDIPNAVCNRLLTAWRGAKSRPMILQQMEAIGGKLI